MIDVSGWAPEPRETTERIGTGPATALAGLLDVEPPGGSLPPLWHWLHFLDRPAQRELGPDGHPLAGRFMPPVPDRRRMIAGGRYTARGPMRFGQAVTRREELATTAVKRGRSGELLFVTLRRTFFADGAELAVEEQDLVYRSGPPAVAPRQAREGRRAEPAAETPWLLRMAADPVLLFRFSALTYNAHRIHYDEPYATGVEGHAGLVVHGPLLALLCLELYRRRGRVVTEFSFRARSPVYAGQPFAVRGGPDGELRVDAPGGVIAMTARAAVA